MRGFTGRTGEEILKVMEKMKAGVKRIGEELRTENGFSTEVNMGLKNIYEEKIKLIEEVIRGYKCPAERQQSQLLSKLRR